MLEGRNSYYNAASDSFNYTYYDISVLQKIERFTREDDMFTSKFISDSINSIYKTNATKPKYELNTGGLFYGYRGISFEGMNIYINMTLDDIERNIKHKKECDIKICIQDGEDIILYYVHQSFNNDNPVWNVVRTSNVVWSLTEEALKLSSPYKRVKKEDK